VKRATGDDDSFSAKTSLVLPLSPALGACQEKVFRVFLVQPQCPLCLGGKLLSETLTTTETQRTLRLRRGNGSQVFSGQTALAGASGRTSDVFAEKLSFTAVARGAGSHLWFNRNPGVPLRSTPGSMLPPALRARDRYTT